MSMGRIIRQELQALFNYKSPAIFLLFGIPIVYTLLFGLAYSNNVIKYVPAVIYDQDQTPASRSLSQAFLDSEKFDIVAQVTSQEELERYLRDNEA